MIELRSEAIRALRTLLSAEGSGALDDPIRLRGLIADRLSGQFSREAKLFNVAVSAGVPLRLTGRLVVRSGQADLDDQLLAELSDNLAGAYGLNPQQAQWAVDAWVQALGLQPTTTRNEVSERSPTTPWYRRGLPLIGAAGAAGFLVMAMLVSGRLGQPDETPAPSSEPPSETPAPATVTPEPPTPETPAPEPSPTTAVPSQQLDIALSDWIPVELWPSCRSVERSDAELRGYSETFDCDFPGADVISYTSYRELGKVYELYALYAPAGESTEDDGGNIGLCPDELPSDRRWYIAGDSRDSPRGRYSCFHDAAQTAWILMTVDHANTLVWLSRADGEIGALYAAWGERQVIRAPD